MKKRVLIFGGSFNPPTLAHVAIMRACLALPGFDEVWVMLSRSRADKAISVSDTDRLRMLQLVRHTDFADDSRLVISDFELKLPLPTQTCRTIRELASVYPTTEFWWALGGDSYRDMANWEQAETFINDIRVVLFTEVDMPDLDPKRVMRLHLPTEVQSMSSSEARAALASGQDVSGLISPSIIPYLTQHKLYA